jgi:hypothetical protein
VFRVRFMAGVTDVASSVPGLISLEMIEGPRSTLGQRAVVTMMRIETVVDMAVKAGTSVEPGASSNKHSANKPVGSIVAIRSTVIRLVVEVAVRAHRGHSNVYADGNLGWRNRRAAENADDESRKSKRADFEHNFSFDYCFLIDSHGVSSEPTGLRIILKDQHGK